MTRGSTGRMHLRGLPRRIIGEGSSRSVPVVRDDTLATYGRGLFLVQSLADEWGYLRGIRRHHRLVPARRLV